MMDAGQVIWCLYHAPEPLRHCSFFYDIGLNQGQVAEARWLPCLSRGTWVCGGMWSEDQLQGRGGFRGQCQWRLVSTPLTVIVWFCLLFQWTRRGEAVLKSQTLFGCTDQRTRVSML